MTDAQIEQIEKMKLFFKKSKKRFALLEVNNMNFFRHIMETVQYAIPLTLVDISKGPEGGYIAWLEEQIEGRDNIVVYGWNIIAPDNDAQRKTWMINFNLLREKFGGMKKNIMFVFQSFLVELMYQYGRDFYQWMGVKFDFREVPEEFQEKNEKLIQSVSFYIPRDEARNNIELLRRWIKQKEEENEIDEELASHYYNLTMNFFALAQYDSGLIYALKAINLCNKLCDFGAEYLKLLILTSTIYRHLGDFSSALEMILEANDVFQKEKNEDKLLLANIYNTISNIFQDIGRTLGAYEFAVKAKDLCEKQLDMNHPIVAASFNNLSTIYKEFGKFNEALSYSLKAVEISESIFPQLHPDLAASYNNLAIIYKNIGRLSEAIEYSYKAKFIWEMLFDSDHPLLAYIYNNISTIYIELHRYQDALDYSTKSIDIFEKILDKNHINFITIYYNIAIIYQSIGDINNAKEFIKKVIHISEALYNFDHYKVKNAKEFLARLEKEHPGE